MTRMILITGATGLVGGNLLWFLLQQTNSVRATKRTGSRTENLRSIFSFYTHDPDRYLDRIQWVDADINEIEQLKIAMKGVSVVYHCAASVVLAGNHHELRRTNITGTKNMIDIAIHEKVSSFCYVSSIATCSKDIENIHSEGASDNNQMERTEYSQTKYEAEQLVWNAISLGLPAVIVNPGVILGVSGQNSGSFELFNRVRKGLPFYTQGGSGYIDVRDVAKIIIELTRIKCIGERFILVSENLSNKEILTAMAKGFSKKPPFILLGRRTMHAIGLLAEIIGKMLKVPIRMDRKFASIATNREYYSNQKITTLLHYKFIPISKTISDVCQYINSRT